MVKSQRWRRVVGVALGAATAAAVGLAVVISLNPDYYFFYSPEQRDGWSFEGGSVVVIAVVMLVEGLISGVAFLGTRPARIWARCTLALLLLVPWAIVTIPWVIHMPGFALIHHVWLGGLVVALGATGLIDGVRAVVTSRARML